MKRVKLKINKNPKPLHSILLLFVSLSICLGAQEKLLRINTDLTALSTDAASSGGAFNSPPDASKQSEQAVLPLDAALHICVREETYVEQLKVPTMQPVRIRSSQWCMEIPPRCSNYKTEMREVVQIKNVTKTRTIRFCCAGYEGNISINDTVCKPVCRGGCGRGYCQTPDVCSCEAGYTGTHCTQRCDHDHWGDECKQQCKCQNGAVCDNKSGICHCTTGWTGEFCELPCPAGSYGVMCHKECACAVKRCHPQTGACGDAVDTVMPNVTHVMIQTLNSTIANITHKLDRIANKIVTIATSTVVPPQLTAAPEVIVIKQEDQHTPKIIVHQPGLSGGLLGDLHTAGGKTPEVIHVITAAGADWPPTHANGSMIGGAHDAKLSLAGIGGGIESPAHTLAPTAAEHDANLLSTLLVLLLIIVVAIGGSWLYIYRRYHLQKQRVEAALAARNASFGAPTAELGGGSGGTVDATVMSGVGGKSFLKPLPDLPAFTQMVRHKIEGIRTRIL
uniref:Multiple epidermal growth factor-like domains protein 10 n=1 Tax=Zeugodacus cucurbitae TaxID=28588 RepID=A0A0A1WST4_ZEUCU